MIETDSALNKELPASHKEPLRIDGGTKLKKSLTGKTRQVRVTAMVFVITNKFVKLHFKLWANGKLTSFR